MVSKVCPDFPRTKRKQFQPLFFKMGGWEWEYGKGIVGEVSLSEASHSQTVKKLRHLAGCRLTFCVATILVKKDVNTEVSTYFHTSNLKPILLKNQTCNKTARFGQKLPCPQQMNQALTVSKVFPSHNSTWENNSQVFWKYVLILTTYPSKKSHMKRLLVGSCIQTCAIWLSWGLCKAASNTRQLFVGTNDSHASLATTERTVCPLPTGYTVLLPLHPAHDSHQSDPQRPRDLRIARKIHLLCREFSHIPSAGMLHLRGK